MSHPTLQLRIYIINRLSIFHPIEIYRPRIEYCPHWSISEMDSIIRRMKSSSTGSMMSSISENLLKVSLKNLLIILTLWLFQWESRNFREGKILMHLRVNMIIIKKILYKASQLVESIMAQGKRCPNRDNLEYWIHLSILVPKMLYNRKC